MDLDVCQIAAKYTSKFCNTFASVLQDLLATLIVSKGVTMSEVMELLEGCRLILSEELEIKNPRLYVVDYILQMCLLTLEDLEEPTILII